MWRKTAIIAMAAAACMACGRRTALKAGTPSSLPAGECAATAKLSVPYPEIPTYLNGEEEEAGYVLMHFWDGVDFSDESWTEAAETMEEAFARFITVASLYPDMELSKQAVARLMQRLGEEAVPDVYDLMTGLADKYLYDPNSPLRNEELYITVLEEQIADPDLEDIYKVAPRERLRMALKNRPGDRAADFSFTTGKGGHGTLYGIDADYVLLFFHNLGCPACREVRQGIVSVTAREPAAGGLASCKLRIIALYPDTDMAEWVAHANEIPDTWINACDKAQEINEKELYDLRAIPSLYLLDRDKKVILKDFVNPEMLSDALTYSEAD